MTDGCMKCGEYKEVLALFRDMQTLEAKDVKPNEFTLSNVLSAFRRLGTLEHGEWVHAYIDRARLIFINLDYSKDVMAWNAMISGLAMHGFRNGFMLILTNAWF